MGEAIVITSGKGGVGKTTTTANIGTALALSGKKVCLVDTDIGLRNLDVVMGLENRIIYDLTDVIEGSCRIPQALIKDKRFDHLNLLPAAQTKDKTAVNPEDLAWLVSELKQDHDYVLIDCPAGIEQGFKNAIAGADHAIVVTTPEVSSVRDADRIIGLLEQEDRIQSKRMIVNRIRSRMVQAGDAMDVDEIVTILAIDLLGIVPDDDSVILSSNNGQPIVMDPKAKPSIAYRNIARRLNGESVPLMSFEEEPGMLDRVKKMFSFSKQK